MITAKNVSKKYFTGNQPTILFTDLSLHVQEGEIIFISGEYGSGRTTLLKMIAAMTPPNHGTIEVFGQNVITIENRTDWRLKHIGYLTSEDYLIPYLNVKQHLLMGQDDDDSSYDLFNDDAQYILAMLDIDEPKLSQYPENLTKIERLKITIARILISHPRILLLDELTTDLTLEEQYNLYNLLLNYVKRHNLTVVITGEEDTCHVYDRSLQLVNGKLVEKYDHQQRIIH